MRYLPDMPNIEGAICNPAYDRAGCRTPMQWDDSLNAGFSAADLGDLHLPIDPDPERPTVATQERDANSTLHLVRRLIATRKAIPALGTRASTRVLHQGYPFAYLRNETHLIVVNPGCEQTTLVSDEISGAESAIESGVFVTGDTVTVEGFGHGIFTLPRSRVAR